MDVHAEGRPYSEPSSTVRAALGIPVQVHMERDLTPTNQDGLWRERSTARSDPVVRNAYFDRYHSLYCTVGARQPTVGPSAVERRTPNPRPGRAGVAQTG